MSLFGDYEIVSLLVTAASSVYNAMPNTWYFLSK